IQDEDLDTVSKERKISDSRRKKDKRKGKSSRSSSSDDEELDKIKKGSRRKKWYSSDENSSIYTTESESDRDEKKRRRKGKKKRDDCSSDNSRERSNKRSKSRSGKKEYTSEEGSSYASDDSDSYSGRQGRRQKSDRKNGSKKNKIKGEATNIGVDSTSEQETTRKEMGLDWMLRSESKRPAISETEEKLTEEVPAEESKKVNPKELNPYLKDNGSGYPEESDGAKVGSDQLLSSSLIGDGGASWRLKALKRAQEQAAREGRKIQEVVEERWGSLGELTASVASHAAAPARAHLRAIKNRQRGITEENSPDSDKPIERDSKRDYIKNISVRHHEMKAPKVRDSLSWGKRKSQVVAEGAGVISAAASSLNKFSNDGSFMREFVSKTSSHSDGSVLESVESEKVSSEANTPGERSAVVKNEMSANQLAAKAMQLRLKGKNEEADKLMVRPSECQIR
ncbi:putative CWF19-like protein 2 isoform X2, partial [Sesbania bispinosa]